MTGLFKKAVIFGGFILATFVGARLLLGPYSRAAIDNTMEEAERSLPNSCRKWVLKVQLDTAKTKQTEDNKVLLEVSEEIAAIQANCEANQKKAHALDEAITSLRLPSSTIKIGQTSFCRTQLESEKESLVLDTKALKAKEMQMRDVQEKLRARLSANSGRLHKLEADYAQLAACVIGSPEASSNSALDAAERSAKDLIRNAKASGRTTQPAPSTPAADSLAVQQNP